jgi:hypothetical protein
MTRMNEPRSSKGGDATIGVVLIAFCVFFLAKAWALPNPMGDGPAPSLFPTLILLGLLIAGISLVLGSLPWRPKGPGGMMAAGLPQVAAMLGAIAAYVVALPVSPFLLATPVFIVAASLIVLRFSWTLRHAAVHAAIALLITIVIQVLLIDALNIRL